jgi:hypothetical protein
VPPGKEVVVIVGAELTVMESGNVADTPLASVTSTVKDLVTALLATVPLMIPVEALRVSPAGREPTVSDHVRGAVPPEAARVWE